MVYVLLSVALFRAHTHSRACSLSLMLHGRVLMPPLFSFFLLPHPPSLHKFLANCKAMSKLLGPNSTSGAGYEYCVVDYLWFQDLASDTTTSITTSEKAENREYKEKNAPLSDPINKLHVDEYGRLVPAPDRWPSTWNAAGKSVGFRPIADKVR